MVKVIPATGRARVREDNRGIEILIPARRRPYLAIVLGFWLMARAAGAVMAPLAFFRQHDWGGPGVFVVAWLGIWLTAGAFIIYLWLWTVLGKEVIRLDGRTLSVKRDVLGLGRTREFDWAHVADLRVWPEEGGPWYYASHWGYRPVLPEPGRILFDYGARTYRFGDGVDAPEARELINRMTARFPLLSREGTS